MTLDVGKELIPSLQKALMDYTAFSSEKAPIDTKEFNAYQGACKSALLHPHPYSNVDTPNNHHLSK